MFKIISSDNIHCIAQSNPKPELKPLSKTIALTQGQSNICHLKVNIV